MRIKFNLDTYILLAVLGLVACAPVGKIENASVVPGSAGKDVGNNHDVEGSDSGANIEKKKNDSGIDIDSLKNAAACISAGKKMVDQGYYFQARKVFHKALGFKPNSHEINNLLGRAYFLTSENEKAKMFIKTAIAIKPDYADAYYNLGDIYFKEGDLNDAMNYFKTAIGYNEAYRKKTRNFYGEDFIPLK